MAAVVQETLPRPAAGFISWSSVIGGAISAAALSSVLIAFGVAVGLSVASTSPTWRDTSAALALLSGLYLLLQALVAFGLGGYLAGRTRQGFAGPADMVERSDGAHGLLAWALAVLLGLALTAAVAGLAGIGSKPQSANQSATSSAEPVLGYELDRLFRAPRRPPNVDLTNERAEAGRILLTTASHSGVAPDDRTYLIQQVATLTGATPADAEKRVDDVIGRSRDAIRKTRQTSVILAFSAAAALLLGAIASWSAAVAGGRHRDGEPLPRWMSHGDYLTRRRNAPVRSAPAAPQPLPE
jgi:hypothetical protein